MYIATEDYFSQELIRPVTGIELYTDTNKDTFDMWADEYARLLLQNALGNVHFPLFDAQVTNGTLNSDADQKWKDLVNGVTYTYNSKEYTWRGLIYQEGASYKSLLADYVYAEWYKWQGSHLSNFGEVKGNAINSISVSLNVKQVKIWNQFVRAYQGNHKYTRDYCNYWYCLNRHYYYDNRYMRAINIDTGYVSMVDFLTHKEDDYPDAPKKLYGIKNRFSI